MKRRDALQAMGALSAAALAGDGTAAAKPATRLAAAPAPKKIVLGDDFFLSKINPTATVDQIEMEKLALELVQTPLIRRAKESAANRYKTMAGRNIPAEALENFDAKMDEWVWHYTLLAINSDTNYPKVLNHDYGPPHEWFGMKLPGGRGPGTGENVDNQYSVIPIDPDVRYELHGQRFENGVGDSPLHLVTCLSMGLNAVSFDSRDIRYKPDGSFVITIDREPANGRSNHMQATADTRYLFIRDARIDWNQVPNAYRIHRLDPPAKPPLSKQEITEMAARFILDDVPMNYFFSQMIRGVLDANVVAPPLPSNQVGGQPLQKLARGHLKLGDDEAFVLTLTPGGSQYWVLIAYDFWLMSGNYWSRQSTLNTTQSVPNADGSYSYVFANSDPGVHNWIDTLGVREPLFLLRYQLLPRNADGSYGGNPTTTGRLVKLAELKSVLPRETRWVDVEQRKQQLAQRLAQFNRRYEV